MLEWVRHIIPRGLMVSSSWWLWFTCFSSSRAILTRLLPHHQSCHIDVLTCLIRLSLRLSYQIHHSSYISLHRSSSYILPIIIPIPHPSPTFVHVRQYFYKCDTEYTVAFNAWGFLNNGHGADKDEERCRANSSFVSQNHLAALKVTSGSVLPKTMTSDITTHPILSPAMILVTITPLLETMLMESSPFVLLLSFYEYGKIACGYCLMTSTSQIFLSTLR